MFVITDIHNGMILSILSISSRDFAFGFLKRPRTNRDVFLTYKPMIIPLISQCGTPSQQSSTLYAYPICHVSKLYWEFMGFYSS